MICVTYLNLSEYDSKSKEIEMLIPKLPEKLLHFFTKEGRGDGKDKCPLDSLLPFFFPFL